MYLTHLFVFWIYVQMIINKILIKLKYFIASSCQHVKYNITIIRLLLLAIVA
jgi:hypothetical protein